MPRTPHYLTLSQAAKATGKSKSVISKALKDGTLSAIEKDKSGYKIDPAELFRVYPANDDNENGNGEKEPSRTPKRTDKNAIENGENGSDVNVLKAENHLLRERLKDKDERIGELKDDLAQWQQEKDHWHETANRLMLTYSPQSASETIALGENSKERVEAGDENSPTWQRIAIMTSAALLCLFGIIALQYFQGDMKAFIDEDVLGKTPPKVAQKERPKERHENFSEPLWKP